MFGDGVSCDCGRLLGSVNFVVIIAVDAQGLNRNNHRRLSIVENGTNHGNLTCRHEDSKIHSA
jgi:hypothetical protein